MTTKKKKPHHPHDTAFKLAMSNLKVAKELLEQHLPASIQELFLLDTLEIVNASYIDDDLKQSASDILYQAKTRLGSGYLYLLCEQQTKAQRMMPLRVLEYCIRIMKDHLKKNNDQLPLVYPMVIYNGRASPYPYSTDLFDLFEDQKSAEKWMFKPFKLIDLSIISDEVLLQKKWASFLQMILKHVAKRDLATAIKKLSQSGNLRFVYEGNGQSYLLSMIYYAYQYSDIKEEDVMRFIEDETLLEGLGMTLADRYRQEGIEKGIEKGEEKGQRVRGLKIARKMLKEGYEPKIISHLTELSLKEVRALNQ